MTAQSSHQLILSDSKNLLGALCEHGLWSAGQPLRLHLGCGENHFDGYINIDYPSDQHNVMQVQADVLTDITKLALPPNSVDEIRLHHVFEHFNRVTALAMLMRWQTWLKPGGKLHLETPDIKGCAENLLNGATWQIKMAAIRHLAGDQAAGWAYHVDHWFPERFQRTLTQLGFNNVQTQSSKWDSAPHCANVQAIGFKEQSLSQEELLVRADALLWESTLAAAEDPTFQVWRKQLREVVAGATMYYGPQAPHKSETVIAPVNTPIINDQVTAHQPSPDRVESLRRFMLGALGNRQI